MNRRNALQMLAGATALMATARPALVAAQAKPFVLPPLPYGYDALEPHIDTQTMTIHHKGHHNAYVTGLNAQIEKFPDLTSKPLDRILADMASVPEAVRTAVRNNGGGHWNHTFFWTLMTPGGAKAPTGNLESANDDIAQDQRPFNETCSPNTGVETVDRNPRCVLASK